jgi:hypothetical protein
MTRKPPSNQPSKGDSTAAPDPTIARANRRAATLRKNLRRRKQQQRLRRDEKALNSGDDSAEP